MLALALVVMIAGCAPYAQNRPPMVRAGADAVDESILRII
jgi:hypothetical protein